MWIETMIFSAGKQFSGTGPFKGFDSVGWGRYAVIATEN